MTPENETGSTVNGGSTTAKIYQFPARGRFTAPAQIEPEAVSAASFDSWYHDVAIKESKRVRER